MFEIKQEKQGNDCWEIQDRSCAEECTNRNDFVKLSGEPGHVHFISLSTVHVSYLHLFIMYIIIINPKYI